MKFAKELDEELVPEWRAKYLNYKAGKKKIKAITRAYQKLNRTPQFRRRPQSYAPGDFVNSPRLPGEATSTSVRQFPLSNPQVLNGSGATNRPVGTSTTPGGSLLEQRPLRTPGSRFSRAIGTYGSIVADAPHGAVSDLASLELPDPAIDPQNSTPSIREQALDQPYTDRRGNVDSWPRIEPASPGRRSKSFSFIPTRRNLFDRRRSSPVENAIPQKAPFFKRMFTMADFDSPGKNVQGSLYSDIERYQDDFFNFLDSELEKIDSFYRQKEAEATDRLQQLRQQLHVMRDQRTQEMISARRSDSPDGYYEDDGGKIDGVLGGLFHEPHWKKMITGKSRFGKNSRALAEMNTPHEPQPQSTDEDIIRRRDFVRLPPPQHVPYRTAKRKLKQAIQEFYRGLELLKAYAYLNRKAFRKINKKYDKAVNARPTLRYMSDKVNKAYFVQSDMIEGHIAVVEDLYSRYFQRGNRKLAVSKLRGDIRRGDYSPNTFRDGALIATGIVGCIQGVILAYDLLDSPSQTVHTQTSYLLQIYGGYFLIVIHFLFFCLDCMIWTRSKINYAFVFEFDTRHVLDWRQLAELPCFFFLLLGLFMWLNFSWVNEMFIYWPVLLISITVIILFVPAKILYHRCRLWWAYSNWRLLLAGIYPVEFRDFFLGDMYCSQTYALGNIELFFCLYRTHWQNPPLCNSSHSRLFGFFTTLPSILRGFQCLRRFRDTKNWFPHLVNFGKYSCGILFYMTLSLYRIQPSLTKMILFIFFGFLNAAYCSIWDLAMDWSLCNPVAPRPFLRDLLAFRRAWIYYVAMVLDVVVRFNWIFYAIFLNDIQHSALLSFFISFSEVCRRGIWTIFRVENEHCTNVHLFRASRDVPLPYDLTKPTTPAVIPESEPTTPPSEPSRPVTPIHPPPSGDIEYGTLHWASPGLRARHPGLIRTFSRIGNLMTTAHAQDFQRKKRTDPLSGSTLNPASGRLEDDSSDEEDDGLDPSHGDIREHDDQLPSPGIHQSSSRNS